MAGQHNPHLHSLIYRFYPTEDELISFYLSNKLQNHRTHDLHRVIPTVNVYEHNPSHLPRLAGELCIRDTEQWFFFVPRQEREEQGRRPSRTTTSGYWKATGSPTYVYSSGDKVIGVKKTMVFYEGKSGNIVKKTRWKMNEYRAIKEEVDGTNAFMVRKLRHEFSLCRVYVVSRTTRAFDRRPFGIGSTETIKLEKNRGLSSLILQTYKPTSTSTSDCSFLESSFTYHEPANIVDNEGLLPKGDFKHYADGC